jgi:branched-chain amino acid transport system ATP-binding protein
MLELSDVYSGYGSIDAVKGVSIRVLQNDVLSIIGANGAGKTTTLKTISGLIRSTRGSISFMGEDVSRLKSYEIVKRGIIHVPEGRRLFGKMSVYENMEMGGFSQRHLKTNKQEIDRLMEIFPVLRDRRNQIAATLSGGEQQMLAIARALMSKPRLLLLDEPSLGVAPLIISEIYRIILDIQHKGTTILLVEQNANLALKLSHRIYIMEFGKIIAEGTPKELRQNRIIVEAYLGKKQESLRS